MFDYEVARKFRDEARPALAPFGSAGGDGPVAKDVSIGIATTDTPGKFRLAVRIRAKERKPDYEKFIRDQLQKALKIAPDDIDLQHTGPVQALPPAPIGLLDLKLRIGSSIAYKGSPGGTLGFFARSRVNQKVGLVSANHVIGDQDSAEEGHDIVHPALPIGPQKTVASFTRLVNLRGTGKRLVDCAFAELVEGTSFDPAELPDGTLQPQIAALGESRKVRKFGKSLLTFGKVTSFDYDNLEVLSYRADIGIVPFENQIEIESAKLILPFAQPGDSGALVIDDHDRAVGLLFAMSEAGGKFGNGLAYASPMSFVLDGLNVDLLTSLN